MNKKEEILRILEEDAYTVYVNHKSAVNINQSGTLNREKLEKEKKLIFKAATEYLVDDLVKEKQYYPQDDISEVDFKIDFKIIKRRDYERILEFIENISTVKELKLNE